MTVRVRLFGAEARAAGQREVSVSINGTSCEDVRTKLSEQLPQLRELLPKCRFAVNHAFVDGAHKILESDEIALIGMVSGG